MHNPLRRLFLGVLILSIGATAAPRAQACLTCGCRCLEAAPPEGWEVAQAMSGGGGAADPIQPGSWTLAIMPDTQIYAETYTQHFYAQTQWIADNKVSHNIKMMLHEGDIVNVPTATNQWVVARDALNTLNGVVPYSLAAGNHDYGTSGTANNRTTRFSNPENFGPGTPYATQSSIGGFYEAGKTDNSWSTFSAGGNDWIVLALEFGPRDEVITWANNVVAANPDKLAILVTHAYMYYDDTIYDWANKGTSQSWSPKDASSYAMNNIVGNTVNDGQQLWDKLVKLHENFRFVFNGHVLSDGTGYRATVGDNGNVVHQILANYQMNTQGGQGDMRLLEFLADGETVSVRTYSPSTDQYDQSPDQQFTLNMNELPPVPPTLYHAVGANLVATGPTTNSDNTVGGVQVTQTGSPPVGLGQLNRGDYQTTVNGNGLTYTNGILLASITQHDRPDFLNRHATVEAGRNPYNDGYMSLSIMEAGAAGDTEVNSNVSAAWFAFEGGWTGAHVNGNGTLAPGAFNAVTQSQVTRTGTGRYNVNLGANAQNNGMLFVIGNNNEDVMVQTGLLAGGTTWDVRVQDSGANFSATGEDKLWSFLYLPYDTPNLIGGYYDGLANTNITSAGNFTLNRLSTGQYELTVNGETPDTGMLILSVANETTISTTTAPDDNLLIYKPGTGGKFLINSYDLTGSITALENTKFVWAFVSFDNPITTTLIPGDYDRNGVVEAEDYNEWRAQFGTTGNQRADGNDDTVVNAADYVFWRDRFGAGNGSGAASETSVPEPSFAMALVTLSLVFCLRKRTISWEF